MNLVGLPACPRGNSKTYKIRLANHGEDLTGYQFAFIANQDLSGKIMPPVYVTWTYKPYQDQDGCAHDIYFTIPGSVTARLEPGSYYFNIDLMYPGLENYVTTILAGTWPILPVPGLFGSYSRYYPGNQWTNPGWRPQLMDQFPPQIPRRSYAY